MPVTELAERADAGSGTLIFRSLLEGELSNATFARWTEGALPAIRRGERRIPPPLEGR